MPESILAAGHRFFNQLVQPWGNMLRCRRVPRTAQSPPAITAFSHLRLLNMKTLLDEQQLERGVSELAQRINDHYGSRPLTVVAVMTGSLILLADLIRRLNMPIRVGVVQASSYRGGTRSGELLVNAAMLINIRDREVLLIDDIFDTGRTLERLLEDMRQMGAQDVKSAVLLQKNRQHDVQVRPDFVAFEIPDEFVVGYGLDYEDMYRNLPYLGVLEQADLDRHHALHGPAIDR
ncbi:Hypoxanthine-guanine phosphoribosyltransferase [Rosistilla carotiformis]|uniref:Hypoxanthine phosphoribosyltransferase n=1 Tax=Rosistilla carotiformis TaxID=2528017 RepID=A0A518JST4_9BACT|nr:Hypoxanthine-guanine phosphoribosyltransferase [Rosistilla carotiformis]